MSEKELIDDPSAIHERLGMNFWNALCDAHNHAVAKHPMTGMNDIGHWLYCDEMLLNKNRKWNDDREREGKFSWHGLLDEETHEAVKELAQCNYCAAQSELVQVAQVAFRAWLWCEQQKAKKEEVK